MSLFSSEIRSLNGALFFGFSKSILEIDEGVLDDTRDIVIGELIVASDGVSVSINSSSSVDELLDDILLYIYI